MLNPNPKKYVLKKLRDGEWILIDRQVLRWRKHRKQPYTRQTQQKLGRPKGHKKLNIAKLSFFEDNDDHS